MTDIKKPSPLFAYERKQAIRKPFPREGNKSKHADCKPSPLVGEGGGVSRRKGQIGAETKEGF